MIDTQAPGGSWPGLAIVLAGGGARAAYQAGVLKGIAEQADPDLRFPIVTGVSAGAINAGGLASNTGSLRDAAEMIEKAWMSMSVSRVFRADTFALVRSALRWTAMLATGSFRIQARGLVDTAPLRRTLGQYVFHDGIARNLASGRLRAVGISATSYATGRTVTFVQGGEDVPTWQRVGRRGVRATITVDHVLASSALPLVFPAVSIDDEYYGDGSMRLTAPLAPAIHLGASRMLVVSMRHGPPGAEEIRSQIKRHPTPARILGMLMNSIFLDSVEADTERLLRVNRSLGQLPTGQRHPDGLRPVRIEVLRPSQDLGELAVGLGRHLPASLRLLARGLGSSGSRREDMLSYLLFERPYIERLIELGHADALAAWGRIGPLIAGAPIDASHHEAPRP